MKYLSLVSLAVLPLVCACSFHRGLGEVPLTLVELYDQGSPDGGIELEIDRDGTIREMEVDIPITDLPDLVRNAALREAPGATITGAEREINARGAAFEVKLQHKGRAWEFVISPEGEVLETEQELGRGEAPAAVLLSADSWIDGGTFQSVEVIERDGEFEYHVKKTREGASYKLVIAPDGTVIRSVREARAEIEIPLR